MTETLVVMGPRLRGDDNGLVRIKKSELLRDALFLGEHEVRLAHCERR